MGGMFTIKKWWCIIAYDCYTHIITQLTMDTLSIWGVPWNPDMVPAGQPRGDK